MFGRIQSESESQSELFHRYNITKQLLRVVNVPIWVNSLHVEGKNHIKITVRGKVLFNPTGKSISSPPPPNPLHLITIDFGQPSRIYPLPPPHHCVLSNDIVLCHLAVLVVCSKT